MWIFNYCEERTWEKRQRVVCHCYFGPHRTSQVLSAFSLTRLSDLPHLSYLISPFLFLSDADCHPIYGSFIRWAKIPNKLVSIGHALELSVSVTFGLWLIQGKWKNASSTANEKIKNQREDRDRPCCFSEVSRPHSQSHIFIWKILPLLFSCGECLTHTAGCSRTGCCAVFQTTWSNADPLVLQAEHCKVRPGIRLCGLCNATSWHSVLCFTCPAVGHFPPSSSSNMEAVNSVVSDQKFILLWIWPYTSPRGDMQLSAAQTGNPHFLQRTTQWIA